MDFFLTRTPERRIAFALILLMATLYIPFAGNYGLWDPWETHYSEVARQMVMRHDYVSLWWPGSPQDRNEFWSKPVLTFWLMAMGFAVTGLQRVGAQFDGEMAVGWTAEWSVRIPFILCGIACAWAVWELVRRLAGRRAALWATVALATASQFFYVSRQAMTDMAFVAPIAVALCFGGLAFILPSEEVEAELPRKKLGVGFLSWPHAPVFYFLFAAAVIVVVPQLIIVSVQAPINFTVGHKAVRMWGVVGMLPWIILFALWLISIRMMRNRRQIYLQIAFLMCGLSTLAKGPAGVGLPAIVLFLYLLATGDLLVLWRSLFTIISGTLLFAASACPWYHGMLIKHGAGFWNEFIGDNYVHRAAGRHGDRGTFEYYLLQIGHGMFPWTGFVGASVLSSMAKLRGADTRAKLRIFALVWLLVMFATMSFVNTKFHHYILPGLPALAILIGLFIDDLATAPSLGDSLLLLLVGVPLTGLAARDLAMFPARLLWLFDYDYVNAPNGGRPWPPGAEYEYGGLLAAWGVVVTAATLGFAVVALVRAWRKARDDEAADAASPPWWLTWLFLPLAAITVVVAQAWQPAFGPNPKPLADGWILVGAAGALALVLLVGGGLRKRASTANTVALLAFGAVACMWTGWGLDRLLTDVSPHWSQKHVIASYYMQRSGPEEPLIAWQMYWRGENFYTKNAIYDHKIEQKDKTVFLGDHNAEKLQEYLRTHTGHRVFFIVERTRFEALRALLPEHNRPSLKSVDDSNNKVYLAVANN